MADLSEAMRAIMLSGTEQILGRLADVVARGQADGSIANPGAGCRVGAMVIRGLAGGVPAGQAASWMTVLFAPGCSAVASGYN